MDGSVLDHDRSVSPSTELIVVTGADGFIGKAVVRELRRIGVTAPVRLLSRSATLREATGFEHVCCDLTDRQQMKAAVEGASVVLHLAGLSDRASEHDVSSSRAINLESTKDLVDILATTGGRLVHTSSLAVLGSERPETITDDTAAAPDCVYGAHKLLCELTIDEAIRTAGVNAVSIRLPTVLARTNPTQDLSASFLSELFWAIRANRPIVVPVHRKASTWLISAAQCARNLIQTLHVQVPTPVMNMPALNVPIHRLVDEIARQCYCRPRVIFDADTDLEARLGCRSTVQTRVANQWRLSPDAGLEGLVREILGRARS